MATFHFELASPEKLVFSGAVEHVVVPGSEGEFGVLSDHAPLIAMLRPGILKILGMSEQSFVVRGGFAEVNPQGLTVLADFAAPVDQVDRATLAAQIEEMEQRVKALEPGSLLDREIAKLDHFKALQTHMSGTAMH